MLHFTFPISYIYLEIICLSYLRCCPYPPFFSGYKCGGNGNLDVATSVIYWSDWIQNVLSVYNLRGSSAPSRLNKVQNGQCYSGSSLQTLSTTNAAKCCEACRSNSSCKAWTWKNNSNACVLMSTKGSATSSNTCISGYYSK